MYPVWPKRILADVGISALSILVQSSRWNNRYLQTLVGAGVLIFPNPGWILSRPIEKDMEVSHEIIGNVALLPCGSIGYEKNPVEAWSCPGSLKRLFKHCLWFWKGGLRTFWIILYQSWLQLISQRGQKKIISIYLYCDTKSCILPDNITDRML